MRPDLLLLLPVIFWLVLIVLAGGPREPGDVPLPEGSGEEGDE